jgi:hypothetical protein
MLKRGPQPLVSKKVEIEAQWLEQGRPANKKTRSLDEVGNARIERNQANKKRQTEQMM